VVLSQEIERADIFKIREKKMKRLLFAGIATLAMSGCATIFEGGTQPVTFKSVPDSASISVSNRAGEKIHAGTTPVTLTLKRGAGYFKSETYAVQFSKEGFKPKEITVSGSVNGWYIANILIGGAIGMLIVDPITGAMYNLSPETVNASLETMDVKTSKTDGSLTIVLAEDLPKELWKQARPIAAGGL
jgi:hypothetical protein